MLRELGWAACGAAAMYLLDPDRGRRRRALLRDRGAALAHDLEDTARVAARDLSNRTRGAIAEARRRPEEDHPDDRVLAERVRTCLGRAVANPHAVRVTADGGRVTLSGPVLASEVGGLLACVARVRGVTSVENRLEPHRHPGEVSGLTRDHARPTPSHLPPAARLLAAGAGAGLLTTGLVARSPLACLLGAAGLGLAAAAPDRRGRRPAEVHKTFLIDGPVDRVYPFFEHYGDFPRFMRHLRAVEDLGGGRSRWVAVGPAGVPVAWTAVEAERVPNEKIAWHSEPGSVVQTCGAIRFEPAGAGRTQVTVRFAYRPPAGPLGHAVARLFGADPKSAMDEDLVRLKGLIEQGSTHVAGRGEVARQDVAG